MEINVERPVNIYWAIHQGYGRFKIKTIFSKKLPLDALYIVTIFAVCQALQ